MSAYFLPFTAHAQSTHSFSDEHFKKLEVLEGTWKMNMGKSSIYEKWKKVSDTLYRGSSYSVTSKDAVLNETLTIHFSSGKIIYTSVVPKQNEGQPVSFTLISTGNSTYVFENKDHDFPQQIAYEIRDNDHIDASIRGNNGEKFRKVDFPYERVK